MSAKGARARFAICIDSSGCEDLQVWKVYKVLADKAAGEERHLRIVDESGEDYLYPDSRFVLVEFEKPVERKILAAGSEAKA